MKSTALSPTELIVSRNVLAQIGLHRENPYVLAHAMKRSYGYVVKRVHEENAWTLNDLDRLSEYWGIPVADFLNRTLAVA